MGSVIMLSEHYIKQCIKEHLGNKDVYENITNNIQTKVTELNEKLDKLNKDHKKAMRKFALTFFNRSKAIHGNNIASFRATAKVHKSPIKLRPVVAKVGTSIEAVSKWLDVKLQHLMKLLPW
jgi:outer membrane murein-binding lipoprotein Lpp